MKRNSCYLLNYLRYLYFSQSPQLSLCVVKLKVPIVLCSRRNKPNQSLLSQFKLMRKKWFKHFPPSPWSRGLQAQPRLLASAEHRGQGRSSSQRISFKIQAKRASRWKHWICLAVMPSRGQTALRGDPDMQKES